MTRSGCWGFLLRLLPITETTLEYSLGPFILPRKPSLHVQAIWNHKPFAFTWVAQPSLLKSTAQLSSNLRASPDFHTFNQSDLTILTWANQLLPHHFVAFMRWFPPFTALFSNQCNYQSNVYVLTCWAQRQRSSGTRVTLSRHRGSVRRGRTLHASWTCRPTNLSRGEREPGLFSPIYFLDCIAPLLIWCRPDITHLTISIHIQYHFNQQK